MTRLLSHAPKVESLQLTEARKTMKKKWNPVTIVVRCKDCGELVGTLEIQTKYPVSKMTKKERFWLLHLVLADAIEQNKLPYQVFEEHNLEAEFVY